MDTTPAPTIIRIPDLEERFQRARQGQPADHLGPAHLQVRAAPPESPAPQIDSGPPSGSEVGREEPSEG